MRTLLNMEKDAAVTHGYRTEKIPGKLYQHDKVGFNY